MNTAGRFLSASAAGWARIVFTIITQLLLVPLFLGHWSVEVYGCWILIQTILTLSSVFSISLLNFVGFELLKIGDKRPAAFRSVFYSAIPWVLIVCALELSILVLLIQLGVLRNIFDPAHTMDAGLLTQAFWSLILYSVSALVSCIGGLAGRGLTPFGYFPRMSWWGVLLAIGTSSASAIAVALGGTLLQVAGSTVVAGFVVNVPISIDMWRLYRLHNLSPTPPDWRQGFSDVVRSSAIAVAAILDMSRQQGVRLLLTKTIGLAGMTAFSTMRTMSNLSLQGIGTVTNPVMPELMRFLRARDTERTKAIIGFVWFFAVVALAPILIVFQYAIPAAFHVWTRGKIPFNPAVFGLFSTTLLVFAIAQPLLAVIQGNNLLRIQLSISVANGTVALAGTLLLSAIFGIIGAATTLLLAELLATSLTTLYSLQWLKSNGVDFPWGLFKVTLTSVAVAALAIQMMVGWPERTFIVMIASLIVNVFIVVAYFRELPPLVVSKVRSMAKLF